MILNVGYGLIEMIGGFIAGPEAVKADALDFIGEGLITFLGLLAIGWSLAWRARSALLQGIFLGVLGTTVWRVFARTTPDAGLMGLPSRRFSSMFEIAPALMSHRTCPQPFASASGTC